MFAPSILITDDDLDVREALRELFEPRGFRAILAGDGEEAIRAVLTQAEAAALHASEHDAMMRALAGLPLRQREVLVLRYYADLSEAQIAAALDISAGAVKSHAHRGLMALRATMPKTEP